MFNCTTATYFLNVIHMRGSFAMPGLVDHLATYLLWQFRCGFGYNAKTVVSILHSFNLQHVPRRPMGRPAQAQLYNRSTGLRSPASNSTGASVQRRGALRRWQIQAQDENKGSHFPRHLPCSGSIHPLSAVSRERNDSHDTTPLVCGVLRSVWVGPLYLDISRWTGGWCRER
jgi:hypothetical protein